MIPQTSIVEVNSYSDNFVLQVITLPDTYIKRVEEIDSDNECLHIILTQSQSGLISSYFDFIWQVIQIEGFQNNLITTLTDALCQNIILIYKHQQPSASKISRSRKSVILKRFLCLVKQHSIMERSVAFYANKLCVSSCYLSIVIKQESGKSVMYWINRSLIYRAKIALEYSDKTITEISDELNFSTTSFFCKFFKNATGVTPTWYRRNQQQ